ncbi:hypothetical protein NT01EI_3721 [Edwardsiella ictaluri 93-146]|uniref:Uncharacterized protein n=1 Tax=Edwardsiella ictaluri (strain 93-146) TaxID=634503 RepID=C5BB07_EDWI9|nr:hypothetical protein NT01EI_3721 [Edwardsiella ictaluri 93-146]
MSTAAQRRKVCRHIMTTHPGEGGDMGVSQIDLMLSLLQQMCACLSAE